MDCWYESSSGRTPDPRADPRVSLWGPRKVVVAENGLLVAALPWEGLVPRVKPPCWSWGLVKWVLATAVPDPRLPRLGDKGSAPQKNYGSKDDA